MTPTVSLPELWRAEAEILRRRGAGPQADVLESCATELEEREQTRELERLSLEQAAAESGFSYSALQKMVAQGEITNVGRKGKPLVRRGELPRKARRGQMPDLAGAVIAGRIGGQVDKRGAASHNA
jgi:hypothetical protein